MNATPLLLFFTWSIFLAPHDIHVSVTDIDISGDKVEMTVKTFLDDLQLAVGLTGGQDVPANYTSAEDLISEYLIDEISIKIDTMVVQMGIDEISASPDAVWISLSAEVPEGYIAKSRAIEVRQSLLTKIYDDQKNLINIKVDGQKKSEILDGDQINWVIKI